MTKITRSFLTVLLTLSLLLTMAVPAMADSRQDLSAMMRDAMSTTGTPQAAESTFNMSVDFSGMAIALTGTTASDGTKAHCTFELTLPAIVAAETQGMITAKVSGEMYADPKSNLAFKVAGVKIPGLPTNKWITMSQKDLEKLMAAQTKSLGGGKTALPATSMNFTAKPATPAQIRMFTNMVMAVMDEWIQGWDENVDLTISNNEQGTVHNENLTGTKVHLGLSSAKAWQSLIQSALVLFDFGQPNWKAPAEKDIAALGLKMNVDAFVIDKTTRKMEMSFEAAIPQGKQTLPVKITCKSEKFNVGGAVVVTWPTLNKTNSIDIITLSAAIEKANKPAAPVKKPVVKKAPVKPAPKKPVVKKVTTKKP